MDIGLFEVGVFVSGVWVSSEIVSEQNLSCPKPSTVSEGYGEVVRAWESFSVEVALGAEGVIAIAELD